MKEIARIIASTIHAISKETVVVFNRRKTQKASADPVEGLHHEIDAYMQLAAAGGFSGAIGDDVVPTDGNAAAS